MQPMLLIPIAATFLRHGIFKFRIMKYGTIPTARSQHAATALYAQVRAITNSVFTHVPSTVGSKATLVQK